jgi:acyl dehydratase
VRPYRLTARNSAVLSDNKMHDDAVARDFGFRGGLVPGVDVAAYLCHPPAEAWGEDWLGGGRLRARFVQPVYDGDTVAVEVGADGEELSVVDSAGAVCAVGGAGLGAGLGPSDVVVPGEGVLPEPGARPAASIPLLLDTPVLGAIEAGFHADKAGDYLDQIGEQLPLFRTGGVAHPGWLLRQANFVLTANVRLGPWIHTSSEARLVGVVKDGARVQTRARVVEAWEAKGHELVRLDVVVLADDQPVMQVDHVAIFKPRSGGPGTG